MSEPMPPDPFAVEAGDLIADAQQIGTVLLDAVLDGLRDEGLLGLRPVLELKRSDLERVVVAMLIEVLSCGERLRYDVHDRAAERTPEVEPPEPPPGRRVLVGFGQAFIEGGWAEVTQRVLAATNAELRAAVIGTLEESYGKLHKRKTREAE